jgi:hypothetical protein
MAARAILLAAIAAAALAMAGCSDQNAMNSNSSGFDVIPHGIPEPIEVRQVFSPDEPIALLKVANRGQPAAEILGRIHGWPFPHEDPSGDFGEGLFSYRVDLTSIRVATGRDGLPTAASGIRRVYYHAYPSRFGFGDPSSFSAGEPIIRDAAQLTFNFSPDRSHVDVTMHLHQIAAEDFTYKDEEVRPPNRADRIVNLAGEYSSRVGGYLLR